LRILRFFGDITSYYITIYCFCASVCATFRLLVWLDRLITESEINQQISQRTYAFQSLSHPRKSETRTSTQ